MDDSKFVDRKSGDVLDRSVKNKFKWQWLEERDDNGDFYSEYIRKLKDDGYVWCILCSDRVNYGMSGKRALKLHSSRNCHIVKRGMLRKNITIPASFKDIKDKENAAKPSATLFPYGAPANVTETQPERAAKSDPAPPPRPVTLKDRVSHQEALLCSFIAEHTLSLSMAPHLIGLAQELARDPKALQSLNMGRTSCTYKMTEGVSLVSHKRLCTDMKTLPFFINLDESTSKIKQKASA